MGPIAPEDVPRVSHVVLLDLDNCMHLFSAYAPTCNQTLTSLPPIQAAHSLRTGRTGVGVYAHAACSFE